MKNLPANKSGGGHQAHRATHKANCEIYRRNHVRERNKLKHIVRSNGLRAALLYGQKYGVESLAQAAIRIREAQLTRHPSPLSVLVSE